MIGPIREVARRAGWLAACLLHTASAHAFCRTNSCDPVRGEVCTVDKDGCRQGAKALYWGTASIPFSVQSAGSPKNQIAAGNFELVIDAAFRTWSSANCGAGKHPTFTGVSQGQVAAGAVEYIEGGSNTNLFVFRDDMWLATAPGSALALTTVSYDWHTGRIYDADVEVNGTASNITNGRPGDGADLPSIITHEVGHFLGLDHSLKPTATMFINYTPGVGNLRALDADDVAGICALYRPIGRLAGADAGSSLEATAPLTGCALAADARPKPGFPLWASVVLAWCVARRLQRASSLRRQ